ncbi:hypothetical protein GCM10017667_41880 [Streptomyces filamentosus]|uniref:Uncharacterized protein n=1 Tax=Streptomyces filamentosus TaxID=67294 RepID=A0A919ENF1_STRFL|nr:hypothetical protein GCM10017667_41880 [Streptomyces filamentosus]
MQVRLDTGLGPVPQTAPGRHPGPAHRLRGDVTPHDTGPQPAHDAGESRSVGNRQPPRVAMAPFGAGCSSGATLPTRTAECKIHGSAHSETTGRGEVPDEAPRVTAAVDAPGERCGKIEPLCRVGTVTVPPIDPRAARPGVPPTRSSVVVAALGSCSFGFSGTA